jgi:hypothetical protein
VDANFEQNYTGGVYVDTTGCTSRDHDIEIAGFGTTEEGEKYWVGRNRWCGWVGGWAGESVAARPDAGPGPELAVERRVETSLWYPGCRPPASSRQLPPAPLRQLHQQPRQLVLLLVISTSAPISH